MCKTVKKIQLINFPFYLAGYFDYTCQDDLVLKAEIEDVPYFNAPIFLENKSQVGKIDEIFGTLREYSVSVKLGDNMQASSFIPKQKLYIDPAKLLPLNRFLPQPPKPKGVGKKKKGERGAGGTGGDRGAARGGFGGNFDIFMDNVEILMLYFLYFKAVEDVVDLVS